jgi:hypothetical protein
MIMAITGMPDLVMDVSLNVVQMADEWANGPWASTC